MSTVHLANLRALLGQFKREFWVAAGVSAVVNLLMLTPMLYMLQVFDRVMLSKSEITLLVVSLITVYFYVIQAVAEWLRSKLLMAAGIRLDKALSMPIFTALFKDKVSHGKHNPIQVMSDLQTIRQWLTGSGLHAFLDAPWMPFFVAVMFFLHPVLGWFSIAGILSLLLLAYITARYTGHLGDATQEEEKELNQFLYAKMRNAEVLEVQGMVSNFRRRWWRQQIGFLKTQSEQQEVEERFTATAKQYRYLLNSLALAAGALLAIQGEITLGAMVAASLMMARATAPVDALVSGYRTLNAAKDAYHRLDDLLSTHLTSILPTQGALVAAPPPLRGELELRHVNLLVPGRAKPLLEDLNLAFQRGQMVALVGPSGTGKSTLAKLLLGVWPHHEGTMTLDGLPWPGPHRQAWASQLGYMPQEVELFAATLADNICRMGVPESQPIIEAAQAVGIHDIILKLPRGYDTTMGEAGGHLSGGQRQRVALARAIYKNPQFVVLDEPNANLDEAGEERLADLIQGLKARGATTFVISHRPGVLALADRVLALQPGRVAYWGPAQDFLRQQPLST
jgi:ATP-binding cassette subfamily C exporter for protease/lipase